MGFIGLLVLPVLVILGWFVGFDQALMRFALDNAGSSLLALAMLGIWLASVMPQGIVRSVASAGAGVLLVTSIGTCARYPFRLASWASGYEKTMVKSTSAPDTSFLPRRVLPMEVADQYARSAQTDARFVFGDLHPTIATSREDYGRLVWQAPSHPNSLLGHFTSGLKSVVEVDADSTAPRVVIHSMDLPLGGEGNFADFSLVIHRSIDPLSTAMPPVYDVGRREAIVALVRWVWGIPSYRGVVVFDSAGSTRRLTPREAAVRYPHMRLYPERLVRWQADRWGTWRSGVYNRYLTSLGLYEPADIGGNPPPTLLDDARRAWWVVPMEPKGKSYGLAGLIFVDPSSGSVRWWNTSAAGSSSANLVLSPSRAIGIAQGDPRIAQLKDAEALDPMLAIISGQINWLVPIAPASRSQVQNLVLVNAHTRDKVVAPTFAQVFAPPASGSAGVVGPPGKAGSVLSVAQRIEVIKAAFAGLQAQLDTLSRMAK